MSETRELAAVLVADVVGHSRLADADEGSYARALEGLRSDLSELQARGGGDTVRSAAVATFRKWREEDLLMIGEVINPLIREVINPPACLPLTCTYSQAIKATGLVFLLCTRKICPTSTILLRPNLGSIL
jgi:hypothetical protein